MRSIFLILSIMVIGHIACAQKTPDYVINPKGDTIRCKINIPFIGSPEYVFEDGSINVLEDTTTVKEYYVTKKKLRKRAVSIEKNERPYLEVVENGTICLYKRETTKRNDVISSVSPSFVHIYKVTEWYIAKGTDKASLLKSTSITNSARKTREDLLADLLKDNLAACNMYKDQKQFTFESIFEIVHFYNTGILPPKEKRIVKADDMY